MEITFPVEDKRKCDFYFNRPMQKACVTTIVLPEGFEVEALPANQSLKFTMAIMKSVIPTMVRKIG